jgi:hypothetical protein
MAVDVVKWAVRAASTIFITHWIYGIKYCSTYPLRGGPEPENLDGGEGWSGNVFVCRVKPPY